MRHYPVIIGRESVGEGVCERVCVCLCACVYLPAFTCVFTSHAFPLAHVTFFLFTCLSFFYFLPTCVSECVCVCVDYRVSIRGEGRKRGGEDGEEVKTSGSHLYGV